MKKLVSVLLFTFAVIIAVSCTSNEKRAEKLIKDYMFKNLHDYSSYEPVETKVDTAYNDLLYIDSAVIRVALFMDAEEMQRESMKDVDDALDNLSLWSSPYMTSYGRSKYKEAKSKLIESLNNAAEAAQTAYKIASEVNEISKNVDYDEMYGWKVSHKFRCNNRGGNKMLGQYVFIIDKNFKRILNEYDIEDESMKEGIDAINTLKKDETVTSLKSQAEKLRSMAEDAAKKFK